MSCRQCAGALPAAGMSRRAVLNRFGMGLGGIALANLVNPARLFAASARIAASSAASFTSRRRRSASSTCSWPVGRRRWRRSTTSPCSTERNGEQLPDSVRQGQRLTGMSGNQSSLPLAGSQFGFGQHGSNGTWVCDLLPHTAKIVDDLCIVRSMFTDAINHDPAITFFQTGSQIAGRPSMGSWIHYGLGSDNENLPAFVVLITPGKVDQPLYSRLWGSGFLPSRHQGVQFRSGKDAVLYLANPDGVTRESRRLLLDRLRGAARARRRAAWRHGGGRAHRAVPDVVPACRRACPA